MPFNTICENKILVNISELTISYPSVGAYNFGAQENLLSEIVLLAQIAYSLVQKYGNKLKNNPHTWRPESSLKLYDSNENVGLSELTGVSNVLS